MSDTLTMPAPTQRKCSLEEVFDASFIELLKLVPTNPFVRAWVLKFTGKLPPTECEVFDQLKEWVEFNCTRRIRPRSGPARTNAGINVSVDFSDIEYGRADYSVSRSGRDEFHVDAGDLLAMIQEAIADSGDIDDVVEAITDRINDHAWRQCEPSMEDTGDYDYSDHDSTDSGSSEVKYSEDEIRGAVLRFVQQQHPELAAEL